MVWRPTIVIRRSNADRSTGRLAAACRLGAADCPRQSCRRALVAGFVLRRIPAPSIETRSKYWCASRLWLSMWFRCIARRQNNDLNRLRPNRPSKCRRPSRPLKRSQPTLRKSKSRLLKSKLSRLLPNPRKPRLRSSLNPKACPATQRQTQSRLNSLRLSRRRFLNPVRRR